jgi:integrase
MWQDYGWVFSDEFGRAISPRTDWGHWKKLLQRATVRDVRLHDARHTAGTCLLLLRVNLRAIIRAR